MSKRWVKRCWITGVEVIAREAFVLDKEIACRERRSLAQRLAILDRLLDDLSGRAGSGERAQQLGSNPGDPRIIGKLMASTYSSATGISDLFCPLHMAGQRYFERWVEGVLQDSYVAGRFAQVSDEGWSRLYDIVRQLRRGLPAELTEKLARRHMDVAVAHLCPETKADEVEKWLSEQDAAALVERAGFRSSDRDWGSRAVEERIGLARRASAPSDGAQLERGGGQPDGGMNSAIEDADPVEPSPVESNGGP